MRVLLHRGRKAISKPKKVKHVLFIAQHHGTTANFGVHLMCEETFSTENKTSLVIVEPFDLVGIISVERQSILIIAIQKFFNAFNGRCKGWTFFISSSVLIMFVKVAVALINENIHLKHAYSWSTRNGARAIWLHCLQIAGYRFFQRFISQLSEFTIGLKYCTNFLLGINFCGSRAFGLFCCYSKCKNIF